MIDRYKIVNAFQNKYKLKFRDWIEYNIADFKFYVFTLEQMSYALENDLEFKDI